MLHIFFNVTCWGKVNCRLFSFFFKGLLLLFAPPSSGPNQDLSQEENLLTSELTLIWRLDFYWPLFNNKNRNHEIMFWAFKKRWIFTFQSSNRKKVWRFYSRSKFLLYFDPLLLWSWLRWQQIHVLESFPKARETNVRAASATTVFATTLFSLTTGCRLGT